MLTGHNRTHGDTLSIGWQCLLQGCSATYWQSLSMAGGKANSNVDFLLPLKWVCLFLLAFIVIRSVIHFHFTETFQRRQMVAASFSSANTQRIWRKQASRCPPSSEIVNKITKTVCCISRSRFTPPFRCGKSRILSTAAHVEAQIHQSIPTLFAWHGSPDTLWNQTMTDVMVVPLNVGNNEL